MRCLENIVVNFYMKIHVGIVTFMYSCKYIHCVCIFVYLLVYVSFSLD